MTIHKSLSETELHEPKGISTAVVDRVLVSDGLGSGVWKKLPPATIDNTGAPAGSFLKEDGTYETINNANLYYWQAIIPDLSVSFSRFLPIIRNMTVQKWWSALNGPIATTNGQLRLKINGTVVTDSEITITATGSAAGDVDTAVPTGNNTLVADGALEIECLGTATTAESAFLVIEMKAT